MKNTDIYNLIENEYTTEFNCNKSGNIKYFILNYINDTTKVTSSHVHNILTEYLNEYYFLLVYFNNIKKLVINNDKNVLLVNCPNKRGNMQIRLNLWQIMFN